MGYSTDFNGSFGLDKQLTSEHQAYLTAFNWTRRMKRDATIAALMPDPVRVDAGLQIGVDGGYFVGSPDNYGQTRDESVLEYNDPPSDQPGLWCQWTPSDDGMEIVWDDGEKFYDYVGWLEYLIEHFLAPWGYVLNGEVTWQGENPSDMGKIVVTNNVVSTIAGKVVYE